MAEEQSTPVMNKDKSIEMRAVIAAAVYVTMGSNARIASVEHAKQASTAVIEPPMLAWSLEGRRQIQAGHNVR
jgi:hypothetical protein